MPRLPGLETFGSTATIEDAVMAECCCRRQLAGVVGRPLTAAMLSRLLVGAAVGSLYLNRAAPALTRPAGRAPTSCEPMLAPLNDAAHTMQLLQFARCAPDEHSHNV